MNEEAVGGNSWDTPLPRSRGIGVYADVPRSGLKGYQPRLIVTLRRLLAEIGRSTERQSSSN